MKRREFNQVVAALGAATGLGALAQAVLPLRQGATPAGGGKRVAMGTNLSGMEWAQPGLRYGLSTAPNIHFTVPRKSDIAFLAASGFTKSRLPIQWEMLQPMLHDTRANAAAVALIGKPGEFHAVYEAYITGVLDAHAAVGMKCIIDNHNYCRYQDFRFQPGGSVAGLTAPPEPLMRPYTSDPGQVQVRIFSLAPGATLTPSHFVDFWTRAARLWMNHPGFGGYGLMNEPHHMPKPGSVVGSDQDGPQSAEDLNIWPAFAQAAIHAIRALDSVNPIYVAGNEYSSAMAMASKNPGFPLAGSHLVYEVHMYLDAFSSGSFFDYDHEVSKRYSAGFGSGSIRASTGVDRLRMATDWARKEGVTLALTEVGMPVDDPRWEDMFEKTARHAYEAGCEIYTWMGGNHWPIRNYPINQVPGWHQNKTLEPLVAGVLKEVGGVAQAALFDDGPGYAAGSSAAITVYARGHLVRPVRLIVSVAGRGRLTKSRLTIPAGANGQDTYNYLPAPDEVAELSYAFEGAGSGQLPPPRRISSLARPAALAPSRLTDAAMTIIGKYSACKWDMADAHTDYVLGAPAGPGLAIRAVGDSGYGSTPGNAMEMVNAMNTDSADMGVMRLPVMRLRAGRKTADHAAPGTWGLWCKKTASTPEVQPNPRNRVPYNTEDAHFALALVSVPGAANTGVVFQASKAEASHTSELDFFNSLPRARWVDSKGQTVELTGPRKAPDNQPAVLCLVSAPGRQSLRVDGVEVGSAAATFSPSANTQMLIGWGFISYYPRQSFGGSVYAVITGKGQPSVDELLVLERYLASLARPAAG